MMASKMASLAAQKQKTKGQPITIVVCSAVILIMINKSFEAKANVNELLREWKQAAISCGPNKSSEKENQLPEKNGCSHIGGSCVLFNAVKRNKIYTC